MLSIRFLGVPITALRTEKGPPGRGKQPRIIQRAAEA